MPRFAIKNLWFGTALIAFGMSGLAMAAANDEIREADVIIYGGTSSAITAAVQTKHLGKSVIVVSPDKHLGGVTCGGLGWTDNGNKAVIGGLSREFYHRIWQYYQRREAWPWQKQAEYRNQGQSSSAVDEKTQTMWVFESMLPSKCSRPGWPKKTFRWCAMRG